MELNLEKIIKQLTTLNNTLLRLLMIIIILTLSGCRPTEKKISPRPSPPLIKQKGFITRTGSSIVDGNGATIVLKGVNLAGWLLWEGWMWGGTFTAESTMRERLGQLVDQEKFNSFQEKIYNQYVTEKDIQEIKKIGFNVVRVPINHLLLEDDTTPYLYKESGWKTLDTLIKWCEGNDIYVVLDLHSAPGGQSRGTVADPDNIILWNSPNDQLRTIALWKAIANRYKNVQSIAGYDILNEPNYSNGTNIIDLYSRIIAAIRSEDANHLLILEGNNFAHDFSNFSSPLDENQIYSFHMYNWTGNRLQTAKNELSTYRKISINQNIPFWVGEFGENDYQTLTETLSLYKQNSFIVGWSFFPWKKTENHYRNLANYPYLFAIPQSSQWEKVIKWVGAPLLNDKPSPQEAAQGMEEFIESVRFENNLKNNSMISVLNTQ